MVLRSIGGGYCVNEIIVAWRLLYFVYNKSSCHIQFQLLLLGCVDCKIRKCCRPIALYIYFSLVFGSTRNISWNISIPQLLIVSLPPSLSLVDAGLFLTDMETTDESLVNWRASTWSDRLVVRLTFAIFPLGPGRRLSPTRLHSEDYIGRLWVYFRYAIIARRESREMACVSVRACMRVLDQLFGAKYMIYVHYLSILFVI